MPAEWEALITGPMLPASVFLGVVLVYWLMVILGAFDIDVFDVDIDAHIDGDSISSVGFAAMRFLNIGDIPIMIWASVFGLVNWGMTSAMLKWADADGSNPGMVMAGAVTLSIIATKLFTAPMKGKFEPQAANRVQDIIGQTCRAKTVINQKNGQAELPTEGAPLLLNVRVKEGVIAKGESASIVSFDSDDNIYFVER